MTIIQITKREGTQFHAMESQSHRTACWLEGYVAVPPALEAELWQHAGHGTLHIEDGKLCGFTPVPLPPAEPTEPTDEEDRDSMLVSLEYRMVLLELGLS